MEGLIEFRKNHAALRSRYFFHGEANDRGLADVSWHGCQLDKPGWSDGEARALAVTLAGFNGDNDIHVMMNMYWDELAFELPSVPGRAWFRAVNTAEPGEEPTIWGNTCMVPGRSIVVLISK